MMNHTVCADSYLTLHYRLAAVDGEDFVSTFGMSPSTLQMGGGQLAQCLEERLMGLSEGERRVFELAAEEAFGAVNPRLIERIARTALPSDVVLAENAVLEFSTPGGAGFSGFLRQLDDTHALIDFNHPLAGKAIRFEVEIIAVL
ncbi:peptidyl-prolyl cis-trans isomerase [Betaproteobacteria bacterium]|nr:peptidyl-prolyl cis-trans isomerase [Betaproteobacteria bacterium]GHU41439.1 peptidyl-prolyl cis-trans isomerase [Betaproteobacteria bacterium]